MLHAGGKLATLDELRDCKTPPPEGRWHPVSHVKVLDTVKETLHGAGYVIKSEKYGLAGQRPLRRPRPRDPARPRAGLSVGVRNSVDKSFPLGFAAGSRVFVCDNLAFRSELLVRRKHTMERDEGVRDGHRRPVAASRRSRRPRRAHPPDGGDGADAGDGVPRHPHRVPPGHHLVAATPARLPGWEEPPHEDFCPAPRGHSSTPSPRCSSPARSAPQPFVAQTIRLNGLMLPEGTDVPHTAA